MNIKHKIRKAVYDQINEMIDDKQEQLYAARNEKRMLSVDRMDNIDKIYTKIISLKSRLTPNGEDVTKAFIKRLYIMSFISIGLLTAIGIYIAW